MKNGEKREYRILISDSYWLLREAEEVEFLKIKKKLRTLLDYDSK